MVTLTGMRVSHMMGKPAGPQSGVGVDGAGRCSGYRWASSCYADVDECSGEATSGVTSASCTSARLIYTDWKRPLR